MLIVTAPEPGAVQEYQTDAPPAPVRSAAGAGSPASVEDSRLVPTTEPITPDSADRLTNTSLGAAGGRVTETCATGTASGLADGCDAEGEGARLARDEADAERRRLGVEGAVEEDVVGRHRIAAAVGRRRVLERDVLGEAVPAAGHVLRHAGLHGAGRRGRADGHGGARALGVDRRHREGVGRGEAQPRPGVGRGRRADLDGRVVAAAAEDVAGDRAAAGRGRRGPRQGGGRVGGVGSRGHARRSRRRARRGGTVAAGRGERVGTQRAVVVVPQAGPGAVADAVDRDVVGRGGGQGGRQRGAEGPRSGRRSRRAARWRRGPTA